MKTYRNPPHNPALENFEKDLLNLVKKVKFSNVINHIQKKTLKYYNRSSCPFGHNWKSIFTTNRNL